MHQTHMVYNDVRNVPSALATLETLPRSDYEMLSVVLDTSVSRVPGLAYLIFFRNAAREVRSELERRESPGLKHFDDAVQKVEQFLRHQYSPRNPGLALYVSSDPEFFLAVPIPSRPSQEVVWDRQPMLAPLIEAFDEFERVAVALTDKQQARIFTVYLGAIDLEETIESELMGKRDPGDWPYRTKSPRVREGRYTPGMGATVAWSGMAQPGQKRRHLEQAMAHARLVAGALMDVLRKQPFDRLFLAGPEEAVTLLQNALPRPLQARYVDSVSMPVNASEAAVLAETLRVAEEGERQAEVAIVGRLLERSDGRATVVGLDATLDAVSDARIDKLVITDSLTGEVKVCTTCGRLSVDTEMCPRCGAGLEEVDDLRERLISEVLDQGGRVEVVLGEAEERLLEHDGVGAFTRY